MPKSMKVLLIGSLLVIGVMFIQLRSVLQEQEHERDIIQMDMALQTAESKAQQRSEKITELRVENYVQYDQLRQITAREEGIKYQASQDE